MSDMSEAITALRTYVSGYKPEKDIREVTQESYFKYLVDLVMPHTSRELAELHASYTILFRVMHKTDFYWTMERDANRVEDAYTLREAFLQQLALSHMTRNELGMDGPVSFFEMLIALCQRVEKDITYDQYSARDLFWSIIANLGFTWFYDGNISDEEVNYAKVAMATVMDRSYGRDGKGGMFPLKSSARDQTKVEIWYQANAWLIEKNII